MPVCALIIIKDSFSKSVIHAAVYTVAALINDRYAGISRRINQRILINRPEYQSVRRVTKHLRRVLHFILRKLSAQKQIGCSVESSLERIVTFFCINLF